MSPFEVFYNVYISCFNLFKSPLVYSWRLGPISTSKEHMSLRRELGNTHQKARGRPPSYIRNAFLQGFMHVQDPTYAPRLLRKFWRAEILSHGPAHLVLYIFQMISYPPYEYEYLLYNTFERGIQPTTPRKSFSCVRPVGPVGTSLALPLFTCG